MGVQIIIHHTQVRNIHETCHTIYLFCLLKFIINVEQSHATFITVIKVHYRDE